MGCAGKWCVSFCCVALFVGRFGFCVGVSRDIGGSSGRLAIGRGHGKHGMCHGEQATLDRTCAHIIYVTLHMRACVACAAGLVCGMAGASGIQIHICTLPGQGHSRPG
jgi:hypothetical protein